MEGNKINKINKFSRTSGSSSNSETSKKNNEYYDAKSKYKEDTSIKWTDFNSTDPVLTLTGTIKIQTAKDRLNDLNSKATSLPNTKKFIDIYSPNSVPNTNLMVFETDYTGESALQTGGGSSYVVGKYIAYCLAQDTEKKGKASSTSNYKKLEQYNGKKVTLTLNIKKILAPTDFSGIGVDANCQDDCVVDVKPAD